MARFTKYSKFIESYRKSLLSKKNHHALFPLSERDGNCVKSGTLQSGMKLILSLLKIDGQCYAFHSCKLGGATAASNNGISQVDLESLGHWKPKSMASRYTRSSNQHLEHVSRQMCN